MPFPTNFCSGRYPASPPCRPDFPHGSRGSTRPSALPETPSSRHRAHKRDAVCNHDSCNQKDYSNLDDSLFLFVIHLIHLPFGSSHCTEYAASAGYIHTFRQYKRIQIYLRKQQLPVVLRCDMSRKQFLRVFHERCFCCIISAVQKIHTDISGMLCRMVFDISGQEQITPYHQTPRQKLSSGAAAPADLMDLSSGMPAKEKYLGSIPKASAAPTHKVGSGHALCKQSASAEPFRIGLHRLHILQLQQFTDIVIIAAAALVKRHCMGRIYTDPVLYQFDHLIADNSITVNFSGWTE